MSGDIGVMPNVTLFIQLVLFLAFVFVMNVLFVKPYSKVVEEREDTIRRNLKRAESLRAEAKNYTEEAQKILDSARTEINALMEEAKKEANKIKSEILDKAEEEAQREIETKTAEIRKSLEEEKSKLEGAVKEVAQAIVKRILGEAA